MVYSTIFLGFMGGQEILLIVILVLIIFGGRKIPELMKGIGKGIKEFKKANTDGDKSEDKEPEKNVM